MALLILCWQTACLSHDYENEQLLPGATSATEAESAELDKIHDEVTPNASWDEFKQANVPRFASRLFSRSPVIQRFS